MAVKAAILALIFLAVAVTPTAAQTPTPAPQPATGLQVCWSLNEPSGLRYDSVGGNHLTDNNTVGQAGGIWSGAAAFVAANTESLSAAHTAGVSVQGNDAWTWAMWIKPGAAASQAIYRKSGELAVVRTAGGPININVNYGLAFVTEAAPLYTWSLLVIWEDSTGLYGQLNGGEVLTNTRGVYSGANPITLGAGATYFDGQLDEAARWSRALTDAERAWLYNAGLGRSCAQLTAQDDSGRSELRVPLTGGDEFVVERTASYGDVLVFGALSFIGIVGMIAVILFSVERWFP